MANEKYVERIKSASTGVVYTIRDQDTASKQDILISGENIKTINDQSILGSGNIQISGTGAVDSVNGKTGAVVLNASDVHAATEAQGALADTAVQPSAISDMETKTHASSTYQAKLTSANAGTNVTITEESGVVKINAAGGSGGASTFAELQGQPTDNANLAAALNDKQDTLVSGTNIKSINSTSLLGSGNIEVLTSSDVGTMAAENKADYFTKTEVTDEFLPINQGSENAGKYLKVGSEGDVVTETVNIPDVSNYYTKSEIDSGFLTSNQGSANAGKLLKVDNDGSVITAEIAGATVDNALSTSSTNPVQNKVITDEIKNITSYKISDFIPGYYCNNTEGASGNTTVLASWAYLKIPAQPGDVFYVSTKAGVSQGRAWGWMSSSGKVSSCATVSNVDEFITAPANTTGLIVNSNSTSSSTVLVYKKMRFDTRDDSFDSRITAIENAFDPEKIQEVLDTNEEAFYRVNLYDNSVEPLHAYINTTGGLATHATSRVGEVNDIKPNHYYYINGRTGTQAGDYAIRCLDANGSPMRVLCAATDEEAPANRYYYLPKPDGSGTQPNGPFKTPAGTVKIQFTLYFSTETPPTGWNNVILEDMGENYDPAFQPHSYVDYDEALRINESLLSDISLGSEEKELSLNTIPTFLLVGASYGECFGSVKDKAFISYLSNMLDWNVDNYSLSGSDDIEHFNRIMKDQKISNMLPKYCNGGVALVILGGNEGAYYNSITDAKYFKQNCIRLYSALKSNGYRVIIGSYYGDAGSNWASIQRQIASDYGYEYLNMNAYGKRWVSPQYRAWWYNGHYATRTNTQQWYNYMKLLNELERPQSAIKIYRNRINYTTDDELLFDNNIEKMKYWRELSLHHRALPDDKAKYVDRIDLFQDASYTLADIQSEYQSFREGNPLTFNDTGLIQLTFPSISAQLSNVKILLESEDDLQVYVRKYVDSSLAINLDSDATFYMDDNDLSFTAGETFTDENNVGITFTVTRYDSDAKILYASPSSQDFNHPGIIAGNITYNNVNYSYNKINAAPGSTYYDRALDKCGKWEQVLRNSQGYVSLNNLKAYMDYDRVDLLIRTSSRTSFTLTDLKVTYRNGLPKDLIKTTKYKALGEISYTTPQELLTTTTFEDAHNTWNLPAAQGTIWDGKVLDGPHPTVSHIPAWLASNGVSRILRLAQGETVSQSWTSSYTNGYTTKFKLKITARYYPEEANDINNLPSDVRTSSTFDFARLGVKVKISSASYYTDIIYVPLSFVEIERELFFDTTAVSANVLEITALDDRIELLNASIIGYQES